METFKRYDLLISIFLITGCTIYSLVKGDFTFIFCYFIVGGWQIISMLVHSTKGWFTRKSSKRYYYHWTVAVIIALGLSAFVISFLLIIYYVMLFMAPLMAVFYTLMCYDEVKELKQRHSLALK